MALPKSLRQKVVNDYWRNKAERERKESEDMYKRAVALEKEKKSNGS